MDDRIISSIVPVIALLSGLIATYVSIQNRALLAEVRREIAEMENRLFVRINVRPVGGMQAERRPCP